MAEPEKLVAIPAALQELSDAYGLFLYGFDQRAKRILAERILAYDSRPTLDQLGHEFELTRERVRQIEVGVRKKLAKRLEFPQFQCLIRAGNSLSVQLGLAVPSQSLLEIASLFTSSAATAMCPLLLPLLLWISGPYENVAGWVVRKPTSASLEALSSILPQATDTVRLEDLSLQLKELGIREVYHKQLIAHLGCLLIGDTVLAWNGSLADKAYTLLSLAERPMTREQISSAIPDEHSIRTLGNYLCCDTRFRRVSLSEFGLASWGTTTYKGIVQELSDEIGRSGGEASLAHLKETLIQKFGVSERSIIYYLNSPLFAKSSSGGFRLRRDEEEVVIQTRVELTRSCFRATNAWSYRLQIDDELIRGSGRNVPSGFAQAAGVAPGSEKYFQTEFGDYRLNWFGPQPIVSSVRKFVEKLSLQRDDWLYLVPSGNTMAIHALKMQNLQRLAGLSRLCAETSPWQFPDTENAIIAVAGAIGLSHDDITWTTIKRRFLERHETTLFSLVPDESSEEHDNAVLSNLFEYVG